jgi:hypothetical protein
VNIYDAFFAQMEIPFSAICTLGQGDPGGRHH